MRNISFPARLLALSWSVAALAGCTTGDKGVTGVFAPTAIEQPPSVRGTSGVVDEAPKARAAEPRSRGLSVPGRQ